MFVGCTKWPSQDTNFEGPNLPLTECDNAMNLDTDVDHPMYISMFCTSEMCGFRGTKKLKFQRSKFAGRKIMSNPRSKSYALHRHNVHEYSCSPKTIRWHNMWLFANLNEQNRVSKNNSSPKFGRDKKLAGIHKAIEKNHIPTEPLNYGQTPPEHGRTNAMTTTCDPTNRINELRLAGQLTSHQKPCIATNVPDHLPIQLLPIANPRPSFRTNQLHHYETRMLTKHACFLAMFLLTNDTPTFNWTQCGNSRKSSQQWSLET